MHTRVHARSRAACTRGGLIIAASLAGLLGGLVATASAATACKTITESVKVTRKADVWRVVHGRRERVERDTTVVEHRHVRVCITNSLELSAKSLSSAGGSVTLHYDSSGSSCKLSASPAFWSGSATRAVACRGTYVATIGATSARRSWTFHFVARNRHGQSLTESATLVEAAPAALAVSQGYSANWSGYAVLGSGFDAAEGTFNVPDLAASAGETDTVEWVGIDGVSDQDLIQAGVHEQYDPSVGEVEVWPWFEILPDPEEQITAMTVAPGDNVTVQIAKIGGTNWGIEVKDNTTGQSYATDQTYSGPETSAEWVVEAPSIDGTPVTLGDYTPDVTFTGLGVDGSQVGLDQIFMIQNGQIVSSPSGLGATGFAVAYGPNPPAAP